MYDIEPRGRRRGGGRAPDAVHGALDVRDAGQWRTALADSRDGGLDVLVNNAGVLASGPFAGTIPPAIGGWSTSTSPASSTAP